MVLTNNSYYEPYNIQLDSDLLPYIYLNATISYQVKNMYINVMYSVHNLPLN